jgi:hypothetical protein
MNSKPTNKVDSAHNDSIWSVSWIPTQGFSFKIFINSYINNSYINNSYINNSYIDNNNNNNNNNKIIINYK